MKIFVDADACPVVGIVEDVRNMGFFMEQTCTAFILSDKRNASYNVRLKEPVDENEFIKLKRVLKTKYVTILDSNYPDFLKQVSCPPFVLFYEGNLKLAKDLEVGDAFIYSAFNDKRYLSTVEPSADRGKFCFDYIIASESHDNFFKLREHVMDKKVPLKDYSKNTKNKQQER